MKLGVNFTNSFSPKPFLIGSVVISCLTLLIDYCQSAFPNITVSLVIAICVLLAVGVMFLLMNDNASDKDYALKEYQRIKKFYEDQWRVLKSKYEARTKFPAQPYRDSNEPAELKKSLEKSKETIDQNILKNEKWYKDRSEQLAQQAKLFFVYFLWFPFINVIPLLLLDFPDYQYLSYIFWGYFILLIFVAYMLTITYEPLRFNYTLFVFTLWSLLSAYLLLSVNIYRFGVKSLENVSELVGYVINLRLGISLLLIISILIPAMIDAFQDKENYKHKPFLEPLYNEHVLTGIIDAGNTVIWIFWVLYRFNLLTLQNLIQKIMVALNAYKYIIAINISFFGLFFFSGLLIRLANGLLNLVNIGSCNVMPDIFFNFYIYLLGCIVIVFLLVYILYSKIETSLLTGLVYILCCLCFSGWVNYAFYNVIKFVSNNIIFSHYSCVSFFTRVSTVVIFSMFIFIYLYAKNFKEKAS